MILSRSPGPCSRRLEIGLVLINSVALGPMAVAVRRERGNQIALIHGEAVKVAKMADAFVIRR